MRFFLLLLAGLCCLPPAAFAADWTPYTNARFGFDIAVPPGFALVNEAENGDGRTYANGQATLAVWGHTLSSGDFSDEVAQRRAIYRQEGWKLGYDRQTPGWASLSGTRGRMILYHRTIALCDGAVASFVLDYPQAMKSAISPLIGRLVESLRPAQSCTSAQDAAPAAR